MQQAAYDAYVGERGPNWTYPEYEGPGYTEPAFDWEGWHEDHDPGWTFDEWAEERGYLPEQIAAVSQPPGQQARAEGDHQRFAAVGQPGQAEQARQPAREGGGITISSPGTAWTPVPDSTGRDREPEAEAW
jgi:hypothetical protein